MHLLVQIAVPSLSVPGPATHARTVARQAGADELDRKEHLWDTASVGDPNNGERPVVGGTAGRYFYALSAATDVRI